MPHYCLYLEPYILTPLFVIAHFIHDMAVSYSLSSFAAKFELPDLLSIALFLCVLALIGKGYYNRYLHPLSSYPGPFWASVTDFYILFTIKSIPTEGLKLHDRYGRWSPRSLRSPKTHVLIT